MNKKEIVLKKHGAMIQTNVKDLTMTQRKLINSLLSLVQKTGNQEIYKSTISYLKNSCNIKSTENVDFKEQMLSLIKIVIEFNYLNKDHKRTWEAMPLLAGAKVVDEYGNVDFAISPFLKEKILKPDMYAPLNIKLIAGFKSSYSIVLYELLRDYLTAVKIPQITIEEFRDLMGIKKNEYQLFSNLKNRVISIAVSEVNKKSDISCSYKLIRDDEHSSKYTHIQFSASLKSEKLSDIFENEQKENLDINGDLFEQLEPLSRSNNRIPEEVLKEIPEKYRVKSLLDEIVKKLDEGKTISYISLNLRYALKKAKENPLFYAINALKNNYAGFDVEVEEKKGREKKTQAQAARIDEDKKKKDDRVLDIIRSLPPAQYDPLFEEARRINAKENPGNQFFIRDSVVELKMVQLYMESHEKNGYQNKDGD